MKKINILYVIGQLGRGGAELQLVELVKGLNKNKYNMTVCCLSDKKLDLKNELQKENIHFIILKKKLKFDITRIPRLIKVIKKNNINIVHSFLSTANLWIRLSVLFIKKPPIITTSLRNCGYRVHKRLYPTLEVLLNKYSNKIIENSITGKNFIIKNFKTPNKKLEVIYNGVDLSKFDFKSENKNKNFIVGICARLDKQKNHKNFLEAAKIISKRFPNVKFLIVGDGSLRKDLENYSKKLGISNKITFTGVRKDIPDILKKIDISVLSSNYEGLPNIILESMASSKPVVATTVGGIPEAVIDGKTGILVPPKNPEALANAIIKLLKNPKLREKMGKAGRKRVEKYFTIKKMVKEYEKVYDELIKKK